MMPSWMISRGDRMMFGVQSIGFWIGVRLLGGRTLGVGVRSDNSEPRYSFRSFRSLGWFRLLCLVLCLLDYSDTHTTYL